MPTDYVNWLEALNIVICFPSTNMACEVMFVKSNLIIIYSH